MDLKHDRLKRLFGDKFEEIKEIEVIILGVGGVGSFVLDCLHRSGVENITIVDFDRYEITNQNRQIGSEDVGAIKVESLAKKYRNITPIVAKVDQEFIDEFDFDRFDFVIDAIDDIPAKVELAKKVHKKLISSLGGAKRIDPTMIKVDTIWNSRGGRFSRKFKEALKRSGFDKSFKVVYSDEEPICKEMGSFVGVTGAFGLTICSQIIKDRFSK